MSGTAVALSAVAPSVLLASGARVPVLMYHDIGDVGSLGGGSDETTTSPALFSAHMEWLFSAGYSAVSLKDLKDLESAGRLEKTVVITFDDGYASFMEYAYPLLEAYGFKATINVIGDRVGSYVSYGHRRPVFGWDEYRFLIESGLVEIGCHTWALHTWSETSGRGVLGRSRWAIARDLKSFKKRLEKETGTTTEILAWPYGLYSSGAVRAARAAGFKYILTSNPGYLSMDGANDSVPRLNVNDGVGMESFRRLVKESRLG